MDTQTRTVQLTAEEAAGLDALAAGIGVLAEQEVDASTAVVAATELGLTRLMEDFELPDEAVRARVARARGDMRATWTRREAHL